MKCNPLVAVVVAVAGCLGCGADRPGLVDATAATPTVARLQRADLEVAETREAMPHIEGIVASRIRATVNGRPILDDELREATWIFLRQADALPEPQRSERMKEVLKAELDKLIDREVVISEAEERLKTKKQVLDKLSELAEKEFDKQLASMLQRSGVKNEDEFKTVLAAQGMTLPNLKRQIMRGFMSSEYMRSRIYPQIEGLGHNELRQYFDEHPGEFQNEDRVKWQDIFIDADAPQFHGRGDAARLAQQIAEQVRHGAEFAQLSTQYNMGESKYRNGDGLGQKRGEIKPPEVEGLLFAMKADQVAVQELPTGFHIVRLVHRDVAGPMSFDDEKTQVEIRHKLQNAIADREYKRILKDLRRKATIQVFLND